MQINKKFQNRSGIVYALQAIKIKSWIPSIYNTICPTGKGMKSLA